MLQGRFRWKIILLLIACFCAVGTGWLVLNRLQRSAIHGRFLEQAKRAEENKQFDRAARFLRLYLLNKSDDVETWVRYGKLLEVELKNTPRIHVLNAYERVLDLDRSNKDIQRRVAKLYMDFGRFDDAFQLLKDLQDSGAANAEVYYLLGEHALAKSNSTDKVIQKQKWIEAEKHYRDAIGLAPEKLESYIRLVQLLRTGLAKPDHAEQVLDNMVRANSKTDTAYLVRAAFRQVGEDEFLAKPIIAATWIGLSCTPCWFGLSDSPLHLVTTLPAFKKQRDFESARQDLITARKIAPDKLEVLLASANHEVLEAREKESDRNLHFAEGRKYLDRAQELFPNDPRVMPQYVVLELAANRREEAIKILRSAQKKETRKKERVDLLWDLASLLIDEGVVADADEVILEMKKYGKEPYFLDFLRAKIAIQQSRWNDAISFLEIGRPLLLARNPAMALQADLYLGQCYDQLGEVGKQLAVYQRAQKLDPLNRAARFGVARALVLNNRLDEALVESQALTGGHLFHARLLVLKNFRAETPNWSEVDQILRAIVASEPSVAMQVALLRAEVAYAEGRILEDQAISQEKRKEPKDVQRKLELAKERFDLASKIVEEAKSEHPKFIEPWIAAAALAGRQNDEPGAVKARKILDDARSAFPDKVEWRLAKLRYLPEKNKDALAVLRPLGDNIDNLDRLSKGQLLRGLAENYERLGETQESEKLWHQLADLEPNRLGVHLLLFDFYLRRGDVAAMEKTLSHIRRTELTGGPFSRFGHAQLLIHQVAKNTKMEHSENRKWTAADKAKIEEAKRDLVAAHGQDPTWARIPLSLATIAELENDMDAAIKHMRDAVDLGNRQLPLFKTLIMNLMKKSRYSEVDQLLQKLKDGDYASDNYLQMKAAEISLFNKSENAFDLTERAVAKDSQNYEDYLWKGQMFSALGKRDNAELALRTSISLAGGKPAPWVALVHLEARMGDAKKAVEVIEQMKGTVSPNKLTLALAQSYEIVGRAASQFEKVDQDYFAMAEKLYIQALAAETEDIDRQRLVLKEVVGFYQKRGNAKEVEKYLRSVLDPKVDSPEELVAWAKRSLAMALGFQNDPAKLNEGLKLVEHNLEKYPSSMNDQLTKGILLAAIPEKRKDAIKTLEDAFQKTPPTLEQTYILGSLYEANNERLKAREYTTAMLAKHKNDDNYQTFLANFVDKLMARTDDRADQARAISLIPALAESINKNLEDKKRLAHGTAILTNLLRRHPNLTEPIIQEIGTNLENSARKTNDKNNLLLLADFVGNTGQVDVAITLCEQISKDMNPRQVVAVAVGVVGSKKANAEQFDRVEKLVNYGREKEPKLIEWDMHLAVLKERRGDFAAAESLYRNVLSRNPDNAIIMNNLGFLLGLRGKSAEANELIEKVIKKIGPNPELLDSRAAILLAQGKLADAEKDVKASLAEARTPYGLFHLAQILRAKGNTNDATKIFAEAVRLGLKEEMVHPLEVAHFEAITKMTSRD